MKVEQAKEILNNSTETNQFTVLVKTKVKTAAAHKDVEITKTSLYFAKLFISPAEQQSYVASLNQNADGEQEEKRPSYFYHDDECFSVCHHKTDDTKKYLMVFPLDVSASYDIAGEHCALADIQQYLTKSEFASQSTTFNRETLAYRTIGMDNVVSITPQDADE